LIPSLQKNYSDQKFNKELNRQVKLGEFDIMWIIIKNSFRGAFKRDILPVLTPSTSATIMGNYVVSNMIPMMENYYIHLSHWNNSLLAMSARIYEKEHHQFPRSIKKFIPDELKEYNKDAFNKFRSYKLLNLDGYLFIYGVGNDRTNNDGMGIATPITDRLNKIASRNKNQQYDIGLRLIPYY